MENANQPLTPMRSSAAPEEKNKPRWSQWEKPNQEGGREGGREGRRQGGTEAGTERERKKEKGREKRAKERRRRRRRGRRRKKGDKGGRHKSRRDGSKADTDETTENGGIMMKTLTQRQPTEKHRTRSDEHPYQPTRHAGLGRPSPPHPSAPSLARPPHYTLPIPM